MESHQSLTRIFFDAKSVKNDNDTVKEKTKGKTAVPYLSSGVFFR